MTLAQIQAQIMFQTNNDADDLGDYTPHIDDYINEAYDRIIIVWDHKHVPCTDYPALTTGTDVPNLPEWLHRYLVDWATWLIYRNGNPQKQSRGMAYRAAFEDMLREIATGKDGFNEDGSKKRYRNFINIPR